MFVYYTILKRVVCDVWNHAQLEETSGACFIGGEGSMVRAGIFAVTWLGDGSAGWIGASINEWVGPPEPSGARWGPVCGGLDRIPIKSVHFWTTGLIFGSLERFLAAESIEHTTRVDLSLLRGNGYFVA